MKWSKYVLRLLNLSRYLKEIILIKTQKLFLLILQFFLDFPFVLERKKRTDKLSGF